MRFVSKAKATLHSPLSIGRAEPQLLHVCVARAVQRVNAGPAQLRPKLLQQAGQRQDLRPHVLVQLVELRLKLVADLNNPTHPCNMTYSSYYVKYIYAAEVAPRASLPPNQFAVIERRRAKHVRGTGTYRARTPHRFLSGYSPALLQHQGLSLRNESSIFLSGYSTIAMT